MSRFPAWYAVGQHASLIPPRGWDAVNIGGLVLNAYANVSGFQVALKVDPRKAKGANASHPSTHGLDVMEGDVRLCVLDQQQMDDVDEALPLIVPPTNLAPLSLDHPKLRSIILVLGRLDVIVKGFSQWDRSSAMPNAMEMKLRCMHWPPAQKEKGKSNTPATFKDLPGLAAKQEAKNIPPMDRPSAGRPPPL